MDKVIIDRVDISECKYLNKVVNEEPYCNIDEEHLYTCSSDENCYYKQLKRKEQECERIREYKCTDCIKHIISDSHKKALSQFNELKAENERLKEANFILRERTINYSEYKEKQYKQALQEIREIADIIANANCNYVIEAGNIIKKINEVIGVE